MGSKKTKETKTKKICLTFLLLLGMIRVLGSCGNKGNSDFTKEEMDEIDAAFSAEERRELRAELNGESYGGSSKKEIKVTYVETIKIDSFENVLLDMNINELEWEFSLPGMFLTN